MNQNSRGFGHPRGFPPIVGAYSTYRSVASSHVGTPLLVFAHRLYAPTGYSPYCYHCVKEALLHSYLHFIRLALPNQAFKRAKTSNPIQYALMGPKQQKQPKKTPTPTSTQESSKKWQITERMEPGCSGAWIMEAWILL